MPPGTNPPSYFSNVQFEYFEHNGHTYFWDGG
jgi:hypothetical protein